MKLFGKSTAVSADGYERRTVRGYVNKGKVAKMLAEGWEIESSQQVQLSGTTLQQATFHLKRKVG